MQGGALHGVRAIKICNHDTLAPLQDLPLLLDIGDAFSLQQHMSSAGGTVCIGPAAAAQPFPSPGEAGCPAAAQPPRQAPALDLHTGGSSGGPQVDSSNQPRRHDVCTVSELQALRDHLCEQLRALAEELQHRTIIEVSLCRVQRDSQGFIGFHPLLVPDYGVSAPRLTSPRRPAHHPPPPPSPLPPRSTEETVESDKHPGVYSSQVTPRALGPALLTSTLLTHRSHAPVEPIVASEARTSAACACAELGNAAARDTYCCASTHDVQIHFQECPLSGHMLLAACWTRWGR